MKIIKIIAAISILFFMPQAKAQTSENNNFVQDNTKTLSDKEKNELNQILENYNKKSENTIKIEILIGDPVFTTQRNEKIQANFFIPENTIVMALNSKTEKYYTLTSENLKNFLPEKEKDEISKNNQIFFENHRFLDGFKATIENIKILIKENQKIQIAMEDDKKMTEILKIILSIIGVIGFFIIIICQTSYEL